MPQKPNTTLNPSLDDFSTKASLADEKRRRKTRKALLADWRRSRAAIDVDNAQAIRDISDAEWQAAQDAEQEEEL